MLSGVDSIGEGNTLQPLPVGRQLPIASVKRVKERR